MAMGQYNRNLEDQARGLNDVGLITAFRCGKEFAVRTGGNYPAGAYEKALTFCDTAEEREWFSLGFREEMYDLRQVIEAAGGQW